jgi:hypothetical protein
VSSFNKKEKKEEKRRKKPAKPNPGIWWGSEERGKAMAMTSN